MERVNTLFNQLLDIPTADKIREEHTITLVDRTKPAETPPRNEPQHREEEGEEAAAAAAERDGSEPVKGTPATPSVEPLIKKLTSNSLNISESVQQQVQKQKYAPYQRERVEDSASAVPPDEDPSNQPQPGEEAHVLQKSYLERTQAQANSLLRHKHTRTRTPGRGKTEQDTLIDILYENQRGAFFFGIPRYSANSLLPSDPRPWQNAQFRTSPVDIRNAQVPDPSWEWVWKSWYVDMSRDVDEEGWEYSFMFRAGYNWHGNHPWFHSFVRRRRWLRMRRRRDCMKHRTKEKSRELTADYFTIHPRTLKSTSDALHSRVRRSEMARMHARMEDEPDAEKMEIINIADLMRALRKAAVDREKLVAVRKFVSEGGEELYYLSERMPDIMSSFIFQSSRRQLLTDLESNFDRAHQRRESLRDHDHASADEDKQREHDDAVRHADHLMNAVKAADEQVKKLEYWSDIKGMSEAGDTLQQTQEGQWETNRWSGLGPGVKHDQVPFASKQDASEPAHELPNHPEGATDSAAPSKKSSVWFDAKIEPGDESVKAPGSKQSSDADTELDRYTTAAESASEISPSDAGTRKGKGKGKGRASSLDGVEEEELDEEAEQHEPETKPEPAPWIPHAQAGGVELVEPKAIDDAVQKDSDGTF